MVVNIAKLEDEINKKMTVAEFARAVGIDPSTFYRKKKSSGLSFTVGQMHKTGEVLDLTPIELSEIFLFDNSH